MSSDSSNNPYAFTPSASASESDYTWRILAVHANAALDAKDAKHILRLQRQGTRWRDMAAGFVLVAFVVIFTAVGISSLPFAPGPAIRIIITVNVFVTPVLCLMYRSHRIRIRQIVDQQRGSIPASITLSNGVSFITADGNDCSLPWTAFSGYRESDHACLLYLDCDKYCIPLLRRWFSDDTSWRSLTTQLREKISAR